MKNAISAFFLLSILSNASTADAFNKTYHVTPGDIYNGVISERINVSSYKLPEIKVDITYASITAMPQGAKLPGLTHVDFVQGMERKQPFVVVRIPAYVAGARAGQINQVTDFTISFEDEPVTLEPAAAKTTDVGTSILASGTWYKIGVTKTGFYKIDNSFISSLGLTPSTINPANIRVFGNGGQMLSEDNDAARPSDLLENAIMVTGNGDNVFDNGEAAIFYATGPTKWTKDSTNQRFLHTKNLYSDTAYYFVTFDRGAGLRVTQQAAVTGGNVNVNSYNYYNVHDSDAVNPATIGKTWYGEQLSPLLGSSASVTFDMGPADATSCVYCTVSMGSTSNSGGCNYTVSMNGTNIASNYFGSGTSGDIAMNINSASGTGGCGAQSVTVGVNFSTADGSGIGYLNYIEINTRRSLTMTKDQLSFRDWQSVGAGKIANYQLSGANSNTIVWDVTDPQVPVAVPGSLSGDVYSFTQDAARLHEFAAMNNTNLYTPAYVGKVDNQNLHGLPQVDLIIVTYPGFLSQAQTLADYHRNHDGMRVALVTTTQVYNEFSSGGQDICAIRDFARMFYDRAGTDITQMPSYLLLFGGASYDYKNRVANNSNFVPVFESSESANGLMSFSSDDFYGFLDKNENIENSGIINVLDIGVGRLPARSVDDATNLVDKIVNYATPATLGPWRLSATVVADKGCAGNGSYDPAGNHMQDAEDMAKQVTLSGKNLYNVEKVFVDAMPSVSTPAGSRCPTANAAINQQVFKGTFIINYNGHGNPQVWAGDRILTQDDFSNWTNTNALPFMVTATCDFGQFDHPQFVSAAEQLVLRRNGGVIAILTTTQAVYAFYNHEINTQYLSEQFTKSNGKWLTFGGANRNGKNITFIHSHDVGEIANFRKFSLLGDPAVTPDFPRYDIKIDSITDGYTMMHADTVKALGAYEFNGTVRNDDGSVLTGFNGMLSIAFYDKPRTITTTSGCDDTYDVQNNVIYKGRVSVTDGKFKFTFITPKDINYYFGTGKISLYAENGVTDAAGADTSVKVGGYSSHPVTSSEPPVVKPYINDSLFLNGGITGSNTSLFVSLYDKTGINVSGNDIGHDLTAVLDGQVETPYILNDYYETAPDTYQQGYVSFPITGLSNGKHSITVKAWDVNNNTGEGTVDFEVVDGQVMAIQQLGNYPNPFSSSTKFVFEHNHPDEELNVQINIYSTSGSIVKSINQVFTPGGSRTNEISWDGTDNFGSKLPSGVYVYRLNISTDKGFHSSAYQKLVIVR